MYILPCQDWLGKGDWFEAAYGENLESACVEGADGGKKKKWELKAILGV